MLRPRFAFYAYDKNNMEPNVSRYYKDTRVRPVHHRGTTWGNCLGPETECYFGMASYWWKHELILVKTYLAPVCVHRCPPTKAAFQSSVYFRPRFWEVDSIPPWLLAAWSLFVLLASISTHFRDSLAYPDPLARAEPYRLQYKRPRWKGAGAYTASDKALRVLKGLDTRDYFRELCRIDYIKCSQTSTVRIIRSSFLSVRLDNSSGS